MIVLVEVLYVGHLELKMNNKTSSFDLRYEKSKPSVNTVKVFFERKDFKVEHTSFECLSEDEQNKIKQSKDRVFGLNHPDIKIISSATSFCLGEVKSTFNISFNSYSTCLKMSESGKVVIIVDQKKDGIWLLDVRLVRCYNWHKIKTDNGSGDKYSPMDPTDFKNIEKMSRDELLKILGENK